MKDTHPKRYSSDPRTFLGMELEFWFLVVVVEVIACGVTLLFML